MSIRSDLVGKCVIVFTQNCTHVQDTPKFCEGKLQLKQWNCQVEQMSSGAVTVRMRCGVLLATYRHNSLRIGTRLFF